MPVHQQRLTAELDEPFVVFVVGMRVNALRKVHRWLPVALAMPRMLRELEAAGDAGLLHHETTVGWRTVVLIQYWDSFEHLRAYARDPDRAHRPAWADYAAARGESDAVGIFHETYLVDPDDCESVYDAMPAWGLGAAGTLRPAVGVRETAAGRLGRTRGSDERGGSAAGDAAPSGTRARDAG